MPQPDELLVSALNVMGDRRESLTRLSPAIATFAVRSPGRAFLAVSALPEYAMASALSGIEATDLVGLLEQEDETTQDANNAICGLLTLMRGAEVVGSQVANEYVSACAGFMSATSDPGIRVHWLHRVEAWVDDCDEVALVPLAAALNSLLSEVSVDDLPEADRLLAVDISSRVLLLESGSGELEETLAAWALSPDATTAEATAAVDGVAALIDHYGPYEWPFAGVVIDSCENLAPGEAVLTRAVLLASKMVDRSTASEGLGDGQLGRLAAVACRHGFVAHHPSLAEALLSSGRSKGRLVDEALSTATPEYDLLSLIWQNEEAVRGRIVERLVDLTSVQSVSSSARIVVSVARTGANPELSAFLKGLADEVVALRVSRGFRNAGIGVSVTDESEALLSAMKRADRPLAIEILEHALDSGIAGADLGSWREAARSIETSKLGTKQARVLKKAKRVLRFRQPRGD